MLQVWLLYTAGSLGGRTFGGAVRRANHLFIPIGLPSHRSHLLSTGEYLGQTTGMPLLKEITRLSRCPGTLTYIFSRGFSASPMIFATMVSCHSLRNGSPNKPTLSSTQSVTDGWAWGKCCHHPAGGKFKEVTEHWAATLSFFLPSFLLSFLPSFLSFLYFSLSFLFFFIIKLVFFKYFNPWHWAKRHLGGGVLISVGDRADGSPLVILTWCLAWRPKLFHAWGT